MMRSLTDRFLRGIVFLAVVALVITIALYSIKAGDPLGMGIALLLLTALRFRSWRPRHPRPKRLHSLALSDSVPRSTPEDFEQKLATVVGLVLLVILGVSFWGVWMEWKNLHYWGFLFPAFIIVFFYYMSGGNKYSATGGSPVRKDAPIFGTIVFVIERLLDLIHPPTAKRLNEWWLST